MANSSKFIARTRNIALALAVSGILAACGGGGGGNNNTPPPAATGDTFAITSTGRLINFVRATGNIASSVQITGLTGGDQLIGFDIRPRDNTLVALANSGRIYTVNSTTGAATVIVTLPAGTLATGATAFGIDINPVPDRLRIVSNNGQNLRVNLNNATGATIVDGNLTLNGAAANGIVGAAYTNSFDAACRTQLFYLDTTNNRVLTTTAPNDGILTVVGSLGVTATGTANGFEIATDNAGTNTAVAVLTVGGAPTIYSLNLSTGVASTPVPLSGLTAGENIVDIGIQSVGSSTQAAGELTGLTTDNRVFTFNSAAPNKVCTGPAPITGLNTGENVVGIDTRPANGQLYGVGVTAAGAGRVFVINPTTGAISAPQNITAGGSAVNVAGTNFGVDFNPVPDRLRVTSDSTAGLNLRINVADGTTIVDGPTGAQITADAYTNSFGPAAPATTNLYTIDSDAGALNVQNPPNAGTQVRVGSLNITGGITGVSGFDIQGVNNTALAAFRIGTATASGLYSINLTTGAATIVAGGNIGAGTGATPVVNTAVSGIAYNAVPQATLVGVTADNKVVTFTEAATGTLATNVAITGLASGENVIGIDVRPANGLLYAATNQGATYILNPTTGAATGRVAFTAAQPPVVPAPDPFTALVGTNFGVDFNPVPDRLRLVSDTQQNLRINVANGATITDGNLAAGVTATAAGYTNSTGPAAPASTTLYTIDTASDRLNIQNPPNNGVQVDVGPLVLPVAMGGARVDATDVDGFDIAGSNNFAVAVLSTNASPGIAARGPTVFTVELATGIVTPIGAIGVTGNVNGIALPTTGPAATADGNIVATALVNGNSLAQFQINNPGTVAVSNITGLPTGETLVGVDFRPAEAVVMGDPNNQLLYGVSTASKIYTINLTTGAATLKSTLSVPLDPAATNFGVDFNPVPNLLRVVTNTRQNLRINVDTGVVSNGGGPGGTDGTLVRNNPLPTLSFAAAYTNNFGLPDPARLTQLFVLDAAANSLELQNPPNNGTLVFRGNLTSTPGVNFTGTGEFDIAGGDNGLPLAALQPIGATQSNLYRVNLTTGTVTQVGTSPIGPSGTQPLVGLAIILR